MHWFCSVKRKKNDHITVLISILVLAFFIVLLIYFFRLHTYISHETWMRKKHDEQVLLRQKQEQLAAARLLEKEREENEKKRLLTLRKREHEKRNMAIKDSANDKYRKKQGIYDDYAYVPGYSKSVLQQYLNDLVT